MANMPATTPEQYADKLRAQLDRTMDPDVLAGLRKEISTIRRQLVIVRTDLGARGLDKLMRYPTCYVICRDSGRHTYVQVPCDVVGFVRFECEYCTTVLTCRYNHVIDLTHTGSTCHPRDYRLYIKRRTVTQEHWHIRRQYDKMAEAIVFLTGGSEHTTPVNGTVPAGRHLTRVA